MARKTPPKIRTGPTAPPRSAGQRRSSGLRIAIFTHDTFGLGHVRRSLHLARALAQREPGSAILVITGSPVQHLFHALPPNADFIKLPTIVKTGTKHCQPAHLPLPLPEIAGLRTQLIRSAVLDYDPDILLVDNFPLGSGSELLPTLQALRHRPTRTVLGLRDILDAPEVVRPEWTRQGMYQVLERYYDRILVYGLREVLDVAAAYALPSAVAERVRYCGYLTGGAPDAAAVAAARADLGIEGPFLLATGGGGGDGYPLLRAFLESLCFLPLQPAAVITGPLLSATLREKLHAQVQRGAPVVLRDQVADLQPYLAGCAAAVCMGGYNTAAEVVALGTRAVMVPRTWRYGEHVRRATAPGELEQLLRARALAGLGLVDLLEPDELTPERLAERIRGALERPAPKRSKLVCPNGPALAAGEILELARSADGGA